MSGWHSFSYSEDGGKYLNMWRLQSYGKSSLKAEWLPHPQTGGGQKFSKLDLSPSY